MPDDFFEPVFLRLKEDAGSTQTYPLSAFDYLTHSARGHVYIQVDGYLWAVAACSSEEECCRLEYDLLSYLTHVQGQAAEDGQCRIITPAEYAAEMLTEYRLEEDEAREMSRLDALLEAREQDRETGYDGVRPDHSTVECRGGDA